MARMRMLKPGFFTNDELAKITPLGRLLFQGLWCLADREGRLEDRPQRIKAEVLPYDKARVDELLRTLNERGFIVRYEIDGRRYIQVSNFLRHQSPNIKEAESTIPAPYGHSADTVPPPNGHGASTSSRAPNQEQELKQELVLETTPVVPSQGTHTDTAKPEKTPRRTKTAGEHKSITEQDVDELIAKFTPLFGFERKVRLSIDKALNSRARSTWLNERQGVDVWLRGDLEKLREAGKAPRFPMAIPEPADDDGPFEPENKPMCGTCGVSAAVDLAGTACMACMVKNRQAKGLRTAG